MNTTRAVVLAAGRGTRMQRPDGPALSAEQQRMADRGMKAMVSVGRPFLDYVLSSLANAGLTDVCLVIGADHEAVRSRYRSEVVPRRLTIEFAVQPVPRGTADALLATEPLAGAGPFVMINADNLYPVAALRALAGAPGRGPAVVGYRRAGLLAGGNIEPDRIAQYALVWTDASGGLATIVEKPAPELATDPDALVSMNSWRFDESVFEACRSIRPSPRGELELQDAVRWQVERGVRYDVIPFSGAVLDLSRRTDVPAVAARLEGVEALL